MEQNPQLAEGVTNPVPSRGATKISDLIETSADMAEAMALTGSDHMRILAEACKEMMNSVMGVYVEMVDRKDPEAPTKDLFPIILKLMKIRSGIDNLGRRLPLAAETVRRASTRAELRHKSLDSQILSAAVHSAYDYVEGCAASVDALADKTEALNMSDASVADYREASDITRSALRSAGEVVKSFEDMVLMIDQIKDEVTRWRNHAI